MLRKSIFLFRTLPNLSKFSRRFFTVFTDVSRLELKNNYWSEKFCIVTPGVVPQRRTCENIMTKRRLTTGLYHVNYRKIITNTDEALEAFGKGDKVVKVKLVTSRLDGIMKAGLQMSKNKISKAFYEDRIRLNGERPRKKSQQLAEGDEVDIVRGFNKINTEFIDVARVEVITLNEESIGEDEEYVSDEEEEAQSKIPAVLKRYKSLTIENYSDPWKGPVEDSS